MFIVEDRPFQFLKSMSGPIPPEARTFGYLLFDLICHLINIGVETLLFHFPFLYLIWVHFLAYVVSNKWLEMFLRLKTISILKIYVLRKYWFF